MLISVLMIFLLTCFAATYVFLLRPILRRWSVLAEFWESTDAIETSVFGKVRELFDGLKIKLLARLLWVPGIIVAGYDYALPYITGLDITPITAVLPGWMASALPIAAPILVPILIDWCRTYSSSPQPPGA